MNDADWLADFTADENPHKAAIAAAILAGDDVAVAAAYNAKDGTTPWELSPAALAKVAAKTGLRVVIEEGAASQDQAVRSVCLTLRDMLQGGRISLDLTDPDVVGSGGILDSLVAPLSQDPAQRAGVRSLILAAGSVATSRADRLAGYPTTLTTNDVARILKRP